MAKSKLLFCCSTNFHVHRVFAWVAAQTIAAEVYHWYFKHGIGYIYICNVGWHRDDLLLHQWHPMAISGGIMGPLLLCQQDKVPWRDLSWTRFRPMPRPQSPRSSPQTERQSPAWFDSRHVEKQGVMGWNGPCKLTWNGALMRCPGMNPTSYHDKFGPSALWPRVFAQQLIPFGEEVSTSLAAKAHHCSWS